MFNRLLSYMNRYVKTLQQYIDVDIYGDCGTLRCARDNFDMCGKMVEKTYKFYLAFENSVNEGYITEKIFRIMKYDIVPIVYGKGYKTLSIPSTAYIDIFDFESVESLAKYLVYLDSNDTAYNEYFR